MSAMSTDQVNVSLFDRAKELEAEVASLRAALAEARCEGVIEAQQRMFPCCGGNDESPAEHTMDCEHTAIRLAELDAARREGAEWMREAAQASPSGINERGIPTVTVWQIRALPLPTSPSQNSAENAATFEAWWDSSRATATPDTYRGWEESCRQAWAAGRRANRIALPTDPNQAVRLTKDEVKAACAKIAEQVAQNCRSVPQLTFPHIYLGVEDLLKAIGMGGGKADPVKCRTCGDFGEVHAIDGEWRGECTACDAAEILRMRAQIERLQHQADQADQIDVRGIVDALVWMGVSTPEGGTEAAAARLGRLVNYLSAAVLQHKMDHSSKNTEIERLKACAPMSPATSALGEISMRWREQGDGLYAVDLTTHNLTCESMAHAAMAHLESLFAGEEIPGAH